MDDEIAVYKSHLQNVKETRHKIFTFYEGMLHDHEITLVKSGVGKVFASMVCQYMIDHFNVEAVIFTGVAGSLNRNLEIGDVVVSTDAVHHDFDATSLGFARGQISYTDYRFFPANKKMLETALEAKLDGHRIVPGRILTGDQFFTQREKEEHKYLTEELNGDCVEMEGAAVAQVCHINELPFLIIRTVSDQANGTAVEDYNQFTPVVASNSFKIVDYILINAF